jgi:hypothetical protein
MSHFTTHLVSQLWGASSANEEKERALCMAAYQHGKQLVVTMPKEGKLYRQKLFSVVAKTEASQRQKKSVS